MWAAPTIVGPTNVVNSSAGQNWATYTFTSTDPSIDPIRYGWDINKDGVVEYWTPATGFVPSGTPQNVEYVALANTTAPVTFQVVIQDSKGVNSAWVPFTVTLTALNQDSFAH